VALYALLVGIDAYVAPVLRLTGARNDIEAAAAFLAGNVPPDAYFPLCLLDADATRAGVVDGFRHHLGRAGAGDSAVFWFCGHGSQAPPPDEVAHLARLEPGGMLQTVLCVDSRHGDTADLYDKELATLIAEVAAGGAHVVTVMDCCHADSSTRDGAADGDVGAGPGEGSLPARWQPALTTPPSVTALLARWTPSVGIGRDHVELAACQSHQKAYETWTPGGHRGLFSAVLLEQLGVLGPGASYRELMTAVRCEVENTAASQRPVLQPIGDPLVDQPFLGGQAVPARSGMTMRRLHGVWEVDAGACHGLDAGLPDDPLLLGVQGSEPPREVRVLRVLADRCLVEPVGWLPDPGRLYPMVTTSVPLPPVRVALGGGASGPSDEAEAVALVAAALAVAAPGGRPSPHVRLVHPPAEPELRVRVPRPGQVLITGADGTPLVPEAECRTAADAARAVTDLEHIARWRRVKALANPSSALTRAVTVEVVQARAGASADLGDGPALRPGSDGAVRLDYRRAQGTWSAPDVFVRLRNTTDRWLYVVLLDLTDRFRITPVLFPGHWLAPAHTALAGGGRPIGFELPPGRPVVPGATGTDWLKVLTAEAPLNAAAFELPRLGEPASDRSGAARGFQGVLDRLALTALHRDPVPGPPAVGDWSTTILPVEVRVPER
jgi:hypothetical protein